VVGRHKPGHDGTIGSLSQTFASRCLMLHP
jgi:hypothetical protein